MSDWLEVRRGTEALVVAFPHTGTILPEPVDAQLDSAWLALKDTDWWVDQLYDFVTGLGATTVRTTISRTVIDMNRDPSGASLYPGQATTDLCPLTSFDGVPLYKSGAEPDEHEIARRRTEYFEPYHAAVAAEIGRLQGEHERVVLYDAHSIRSRVTRLFDGQLPNFNIGTYSGASCDPALGAAVEEACSGSDFTQILNGRFRGGWTTRHYGDPARNVHAIQMEMACRTYMDEPAADMSPDNWPSAYDPARAAEARSVLERVMQACIEFAHG